MKKFLVLMIVSAIFLIFGIIIKFWGLDILPHLGANKDNINAVADTVTIISFIVTVILSVYGVIDRIISGKKIDNQNSGTKKSIEIRKITGTNLNSEETNVDGDFVGGNKQEGDTFIGDKYPVYLTINVNNKSLDENIKVEDCIIRYLKWVCEYYGNIELRGIKRGSEQVLLLDIEKAYHPLYADYYPYFEEDDSPRKPIEVSLNEVLRLGQYLVITGASGCGKTTAIRYIAYILAKAILDKNPQLLKDKTGLTSSDIPIPIVLPLGSYSKYLKRLPDNAKAFEKTLPYYITYYMVENHINSMLPENIVPNLIDNSSVILILDGLDEIPDEELRQQVREDIEQLSTNRKHLRIIVTCRSTAYAGGTTIGKKEFKQIRIKPLTMEDVRRIITLAYDVIYKNNQQMVKVKVEDLMKGIRNLEEDRRRRFTDARELVSNPLIVRLLIILHFSELELPEQRAKLYMQATDRLLYPDYNLTQGSPVSEKWTLHRDMLQHLAFHMHSMGPVQGKEVSKAELRKALQKNKSFDSQEIDKLISLVDLRSSVLEESGGMYRFIHMGFQEFLVARYLAEIMMSEKAFDGVVSFLEEGPLLESWWREPILLLVGYLSCDKSTTITVKFMNRLAGLEEYEKKKKQKNANIQLTSIEVAIASLLEWPEASYAIRESLYRRLTRIIRNEQLMNATRPYFRSDFGRSIGRLGDPRFDSNAFYLPKERRVGFNKIAGGIFVMGSNPIHDPSAIVYEETPQFEMDIKTFYISRYQVTVDQYKVFLAEEKITPLDFACIRDKIGNHPVSNVSWEECNLYCEWLTVKLQDCAKEKLNHPLEEDEKFFWERLADKSYVARLPTEAEWEKAARGTDGRIYPWGNKLIKENANIGGERSNFIVAVGLFPSGASPYGILDMCGNVWEWTLSAYGNYPYRQDGRDTILFQGDRVFRGGSFYFIPERCRCATRYKGKPKIVLHDVGFRVAIGKPVDQS